MKSNANNYTPKELDKIHEAMDKKVEEELERHRKAEESSK